jgi:hypothetical protein
MQKQELTEAKVRKALAALGYDPDQPMTWPCSLNGVTAPPSGFVTTVLAEMGYRYGALRSRHTRIMVGSILQTAMMGAR